jgi:hypothetical protein
MNNAIDKLEQDFFNGNIEALKGRHCPICNGRLLFSVSKGTTNASAPRGRRIRCGVSIYCLGKCNTMLSHLDGFCPLWAEEINDWNQFSLKLYQ